MKWPLIRRSKHDDAIQYKNNQIKGWRFKDTQHSHEVKEYTRLLQSPNGKVVLQDLENALNLIRAYERALEALAAHDPNRTEASELLRKWGMRPANPNAPLLGFTPGAKLRREEEEYGDEAFGISNVRIVAERTDEGDKVRLEDVNDDVE